MTSGLFDVAGKSALVTGGSRGIGRMIARGLVDAGMTVYISSRNVEACELAAKELSENGTCVALPADLSRYEECSSLGAALTECTSELHLLVNNAGAIWSADLESFPAAAWDKVLDVNLKAPFFLIQLLLPLLSAAASEEDPARIINIGSVYGIQAAVLNTFSYAASKAALHHLTRVVARELGPRHITVNAVAPGPFESRMYSPREDGADEEHAPLQRMGRPDDIVGVTQFLASRAGAFVTGAVIPVDGGRSTTR
ncbi:MAG: SDR family oxidoreductase [Acidimicrobiia bacterium]